MVWTREDIHRWVSPQAPLVIFYRHSSLSYFLNIHIFCTPVIVQVEVGLDDIHRWAPRASPWAPLVTSLMMEMDCSCLTPSLSSDPTIHILP